MCSKARGTTTFIELSTVKRSSVKKYGKTYEKLEESNHADRAKYVCNSGHDSTKPHAARVKHRPKEERDEEENK